MTNTRRPIDNIVLLVDDIEDSVDYFCDCCGYTDAEQADCYWEIRDKAGSTLLITDDEIAPELAEAVTPGLAPHSERHVPLGDGGTCVVRLPRKGPFGKVVLVIDERGRTMHKRKFS